MRLLLLTTALALPSLALAQGQLTPPDGAVGPRGPVPTMKTLTQVEPRTLVQPGANGVELDMNGGYLITASGSYYLDANLSVSSSNAITISASAVTLDLNGFLIVSFAGDDVVRGAGIEIGPGVSNVTIRNGHIRGTSTLVGTTFTASGFDYGIKTSSTASNILVEDLSVVGMAQSGISLSDTSVASRCTVSVCGIGGINARIVRDCVAEQCVLVGITAKTAENCIAKGAMAGMVVDTATNCRGECTSSFNGIAAAESVVNCIGISDGGVGISATTALNSHGKSRTADGLNATLATGCLGESTDGTGLRATNAHNCEGRSSSNIGLYAMETATGSSGSTSTGSYGLYARETAADCFGVTFAGTGTALFTGTATNCRARAANGIALQASTAENCHGKSAASGIGVDAEVATNCFGESSSGLGLQASMATNCSAYTATGSNAMNVAGTANSCRGHNGGSGAAIQAAIAIGCTSARGAIAATNKYNMP
jgi:hypothetical protein